jgi:DNA-binding winged helix-turn-helix (wHTH) protein/Tfp pilus assembly protein PilF
MSPREYAHRVYRFGDFALDLDRGALYRGEDKVHMRPKAFTVLKLLLENRGRLVTKAQIHDAGWQESIVTDDSLAHCVADIRRALGDSGFELIRTVPRRGYVFEHAVTHEMADPVEPNPPRRLPLYRLGAVASMLVAAVMVGFGAGGSSDETSDTSVVEDETPVATVSEVDPGTTDIAALNAYEKGRYFFKRRADGDLARAEDCFKAALERDRSFAGAWIGLAGVYEVRFGQGDLGLNEAMLLIGEATRHAITLAPGSAEAHIRRATYHHMNREPGLARQHIETAVALDPDDVLVLGRLAGQLARRSRFDEAIELQYRALQGDPTSALQYHNLVWYLLAAGRTAEAAIEAEHYRAISPRGVYENDSLFADTMILHGSYEQALMLARNMASGPMRDRNLAIIHHALGQHEQADEALTRLFAGDYENGDIHVAEVLAQRGELDAAMDWLSGVLDPAENDVPAERQIRQDPLWLLSPYLIELRSYQRWKSLYAGVLEARGDSVFLASAGLERPVARRLRGAPTVTRGLR